jgi:hypothetical protein
MINRTFRHCLFLTLFVASLSVSPWAQEQRAPADPLSEQHRIAMMHSISSHTLFDYVKELSSPKYQGRLTGTPGYDAAANWTVQLLKEWKIKPGGDQGTYLQHFPNPYTLVLPGAELILHIPIPGSGEIQKRYNFETDYFPGSTSDLGTITAEVVYVGYGITAPELGYDEYAGIDVKGKLVLMEPEVPVSPDRDAELFKKWRPYSFHDYKVRNAKEHGASGMVYDYHIVNPNCIYLKGFQISYVSREVVRDLLAGTGRKHDELLQHMRTNRQPVSFATGKIMTMKNVTEHHPEGIGSNVVATIEGTDASLKQEAIVLGAHLDHLGLNDVLMPGAHDNASGAAVLLGAAEALARSGIPIKRTIIFVLFGAEEQGVKGSEFYVAHPSVPNDRVKACLNLESVGRGERIGAGGGKNYPWLWEIVERINKSYIHRPVSAGFTANLARPRQDAAHFMWANIPTISFGTSGGRPLPYATYHTTKDSPEIITPEILEDLARLVFLSIVDMANAEVLGPKS